MEINKDNLCVTKAPAYTGFIQGDPNGHSEDLADLSLEREKIISIQRETAYKMEWRVIAFAGKEIAITASSDVLKIIDIWYKKEVEMDEE